MLEGRLTTIGDRLLRTLASFAVDRRANVALIAALTLPVMMFAVGIGADYTFAGRRQVKLDAIADAAALSAVTQTMMTQSASVAKTAATAMFNSQAANVLGVSLLPANLSVTVTDTTTGNHLQRQVLVTYTATSSNSFAGIIGQPTLKIGGKAASTSSSALNIDFYLMLDTSPSMLIAATPTAITQMRALTPNQDSGNGCAFACHQSSSDSDNFDGFDNYAIARNPCVVYPFTATSNALCGTPNPYYACSPTPVCQAKTTIPLRFDYVIAATGGSGGLMDTAAAAEVNNHATYRMATYTFDYSFQKVTSLTADLNSSASTSAKSQASAILPLEVYSQGYITSSNQNNDHDTDTDNSMDAMNNVLPTPGTGLSGSTPQEILFIVSDGVTDEVLGGNPNNYAILPVDYYTQYEHKCQNIKSRGIKIAYLYTTYDPEPWNSFYNSLIAWFQPQLGPTYAQACASPGLYTEVTASGDITAALNNLFNKATATAHLTQ